VVPFVQQLFIRHSDWCSAVDSHMYVIEPCNSPMIPVIRSGSARAVANAVISHYKKYRIHKRLDERRFKFSGMFLYVIW
jgi:hypothetical protein